LGIHFSHSMNTVCADLPVQRRPEAQAVGRGVLAWAGAQAISRLTATGRVPFRYRMRQAVLGWSINRICLFVCLVEIEW